MWLASLVATAAVVSVSVVWIDRSIALWIHGISAERRIPPAVFGSPLFSIPLLAAAGFVMCGLIAITRPRLSKTGMIFSMCVISLLAADVIKDQLKFVFGRTWPDTWAPGIQSFLHDNVYGFHFFQSGRSFESFPSGHAAVAAAVLSVAWIFFPYLRAFCAIGVIAVDICLVALNLHFFSDVVAGSFVGISTGLFTVALWHASGLRTHPETS